MILLLLLLLLAVPAGAQGPVHVDPTITVEYVQFEGPPTREDVFIAKLDSAFAAHRWRHRADRAFADSLRRAWLRAMSRQARQRTDALLSIPPCPAGDSYTPQ